MVVAAIVFCRSRLFCAGGEMPIVFVKFVCLCWAGQYFATAGGALPFGDPRDVRGVGRQTPSEVDESLPRSGRDSEAAGGGLGRGGAGGTQLDQVQAVQKRSA